VGAIQKETEATQSVIGRLSTRAEDAAGQGMEARESMGQMCEQTRGLACTMQNAAIHSFVELAKIDHLIYKLEVYRKVAGHSQKQVSDFSSHQHCRLGKWYYEGNGRAFAHLNSYRALEAPHARVHTSGKQALESMAAKALQPTLEKIGAMESASDEVMQLLSRLADEAVTCTKRR